jgi:hypothetical protein
MLDPPGGQGRVASTCARNGSPDPPRQDGDTSKEDLARDIARRDHRDSGLVCVLTAVEPCWSYAVFRDREGQRLRLLPRGRKCLFIYHYRVHPEFGFLNARNQTWFPFQIQIWNGREWLARQIDAAWLSYVRQDNCFVWLQDWPTLLDGIARTLNPRHAQLLRPFR